MGLISALGGGYTLALDGVVVPQKDQVCSLEVLLDLALLLNKWVVSVTRNGF